MEDRYSNRNEDGRVGKETKTTKLNRARIMIIKPKGGGGRLWTKEERYVLSMRDRGLIGSYKPSAEKVIGRKYGGIAMEWQRRNNQGKRMQPRKRDIYGIGRFIAELDLVFSLRCFPEIFR